MKKKILSCVLLTVCAIAMMIPNTVSAETDEYKYGIVGSVFVKVGDNYPTVRFLDATGYGEKYLTTIKTKINGESIEYVSYDYAEQLNTLLRGKYVQYVVQSGELQFINYDTDPMVTYTGATYDVETGKFDCVDAVLPVYYCNTDYGYVEQKPVYLDENHRYTIEVCDYGINIVDFEAIGKDETIKEIYIGDVLGTNSKKSIVVEISSTATSGKIKGELYDEKMNLIATTDNVAINSYIVFSDLPNEKQTYTIKIWLEDDMGEKTSYVYSKSYEIKPAHIKYGIVGGVFVKAGDVYPSVRIVDAAGNSETYLMMANTKVNEEPIEYNSYDYMFEQLNGQLKGKCVQYAVQNGDLHFINYENKTSFISGSVDSQTGELSATLHNNYDETKTGTLLIATYAEGRLEKATTKPMSVESRSSEDISETVDLTSKTDEVKLFFWDSLTNIQSYGKTISVDVK